MLLAKEKGGRERVRAKQNTPADTFIAAEEVEPNAPMSDMFREKGGEVYLPAAE